MLTPRGWWLVLFAVAQVALGAIRAAQGDTLLLLFGLAVLLWVAAEALLFAARAKLALAAVTVRREFGDGRRAVASVWAGRPLDVDILVELDHPLAVPHLAVEDRLPAGAGEVTGDRAAFGPLSRSRPVRLAYRVRPPEAGELRFEGVRLTLGDAQGFFTATRFVRHLAAVPVLPPLFDADGGTGTDRRMTALPPPGVHRLRKPGGGGDLLDLRDYVPGDPPKQIAWKASARRDRLITKQYESEVPVRSVLFLDASQSVRVGGTLARLVGLASAVAQSAAADRDLVGLTLFDEAGSRTLPPARGPRHLTDLLRRLAEAARLRPTVTGAPAAAVLPPALALAHDLYPELMTPGVNRVPVLMSWRPLLDSRLAGPVLTLLSVPLALFAVLWATVGDELSRAELDLGEWRLLAGALLVLPLVGLAVWLGYGLSGFLPWVRKRLADRKRLAAVLAWRDGTGPGGVAKLCADDAAFADAARRFLAEHHAEGAVALTDEAGRDRFAAPEKVAVLAGALTRAVGRARDNEVYVVLADLLERADDLAPLLAAVRVAVARHHHVLVVCPWPPGVPPPGSAPPAGDGARAAAVRQFLAGHDAVRRAFGRLGVRVLAAGPDLPARAVLDRLDRLRKLGNAT